MESKSTRLIHWAKVDQAKKCEMWLSLRMTGDLALTLSLGALFPLLGLLALTGVGSDVLQTLWMVHRLRAQVERVGYRGNSVVAAQSDRGIPFGNPWKPSQSFIGTGLHRSQYGQVPMELNC